tara:strand:- start:125 stop:442 length:318 start_codon:yes stop_codon:yes gene_type:complete
MKTLNLLKKYHQLLEQDGEDVADVADVGTEGAPEAQPEALTPQAEIYLSKIAALAFSYSPTPEEENIINSLEKEFGQSNPKTVVDQIQDILQSSNNAFEKELDEV